MERSAPTGSLVAWDPVAQEARWAVPYDDIWNGETLTTAGNLVFQGTSGMRFAAYRATDGTRLWEQEVGGGIIAAPIAYELDGIQYVAVMAGWGGSYSVSGRGRPVVQGRMLVLALGGAGPVTPTAPL